MACVLKLEKESDGHTDNPLAQVWAGLPSMGRGSPVPYLAPTRCLQESAGRSSDVPAASRDQQLPGAGTAKERLSVLPEI